MDGVLVREEEPIPGADRFIARLRELGTRFMVLTNNSIYTAGGGDLDRRLRRRFHRVSGSCHAWGVAQAV